MLSSTLAWFVLTFPPLCTNVPPLVSKFFTDASPLGNQVKFSGEEHRSVTIERLSNPNKMVMKFTAQHVIY